MTTKAADDFESIRRRLEEIEAEQKLALTGSSAPVQEAAQEKELVTEHGDYLVWEPSALNEAARQHLAQRNQYQAAADNMKSLAHPEWPYAGTGFEWRRFVRS